MREGSTLYWLLTDHMGSTAITAYSNGNKKAELRYYPWGETRYSYGSTPTSLRFTGQREDATIGLYFYDARYYHPALGRFISADTIVPEPGNPQDLNRYSYVRNDPLRYTDPSGYYSEEEIMQAFGMSTWDDVLAYFRENSELAGRWGWLEVLRRAEDGYMVYGNEPALLSSDETSIVASWGGVFGRNDEGEILVGNESNIEFALQYGEYTLQRPGRPGFLSPYPEFYTRADKIHHHPHWRRSAPDKEAAMRDLSSIGIDLVGNAAIATYNPVGIAIGGFALGFGVWVDLSEGAEGLLNRIGYRYTGSYTSDHILDMVGVLPEVGILSDGISALSHISGVYIEITP